MKKPERIFTVLLIPEIGKRTISFRIPLPYLAALVLVAPVMSLVIAVQYHGNRSLNTTLIEMEALQQTNREQQTQIAEMGRLAEQAQTKLDQLTELEHQIRALTSFTPVGRSTVLPEQSSLGGRGGPRTEMNGENATPRLPAQLLDGAGDYQFRQRTMNSPKQPESPVQALNRAQKTSAQMSTQLWYMSELHEALRLGQDSLVKHLQIQAHRPIGIPLSGASVTSRFGWRWSPLGNGRQIHNGIDLAHDYGEPIVATGAGTVLHAGWKSGGYGNTVIVDHGYGFQTVYAHMIKWDVRLGEQVERGTVLGRVGSSGDSTGPHLHYEVHLDGEPVDPAKYF